MQEISADKSQSVVDTSLTELAFIFFFILLVFAVLKVSELINFQDKVIEEKELAKQHVLELEVQMDSLISSTLPIRQALNYPNLLDESEIFVGLEKDSAEVVKIIEENRFLEDKFQNQGLIKDDFIEYTKAFSRLGNDLKGVLDLENKNPEDIAKEVIDKLVTLNGQNANLRRRIVEQGNGLDFPPCWADREGNIQFVYTVIMNEESLEVLRAWPDSLDARVERMPYIQAALGVYNTSKNFWIATNKLYRNSVENECRHFVKIKDNVESKRAFKKYLLTIERHFYKLLLRDE